MAFNEELANKIREALVDVPNVYEKHMFGGVCFMVNDKMCVGVVKDEMMCRINPDKEVDVLEIIGCRPMDFTGKRMKGYVYINDEGMKNKKAFNYWINLCLEFNPLAKASAKKVTKEKKQ